MKKVFVYETENHGFSKLHTKTWHNQTSVISINGLLRVRQTKKVWAMF